MHRSVSKGFALAALALVSVHQSEAFLTEQFRKVSVERLTAGGLFRSCVIHTAAREFVKTHLPDSELFSVGSASLHARELWETLASVLVEAVWASQVSGTDPEQAAKLVVYGSFVHKLLAEAWHALALGEFFNDEVKDKYDEFGRPFIQEVLALQLQETLQGLNFPRA